MRAQRDQAFKRLERRERRGPREKKGLIIHRIFNKLLLLNVARSAGPRLPLPHVGPAPSAGASCFRRSAAASSTNNQTAARSTIKMSRKLGPPPSASA